MKFSSLAALEVVILTTSSAANDENFIKMTFSVLMGDDYWSVFKTNGHPVVPGDQKFGLDQLNLTLGK